MPATLVGAQPLQDNRLVTCRDWGGNGHPHITSWRGAGSDLKCHKKVWVLNLCFLYEHNAMKKCDITVVKWSNVWYIFSNANTYVWIFLAETSCIYLASFCILTQLNYCIGAWSHYEIFIHMRLAKNNYTPWGQAFLTRQKIILVPFLGWNNWYIIIVKMAIDKYSVLLLHNHNWTDPWW